MSVANDFRRAIENQDLAAISELLAPDIRFHSPVKFTPFEGKETVLALLNVLITDVFTDFRYVGQYDGAVDEGDGPRESHVLSFRAKAGEKQIHGVDIVEPDANGLIQTFTVMLRPFSAAQTVSDAVLAGFAKLYGSDKVAAPNAG
ncbi:MAG: nuclear transport factor 2 family protein [Segniliparus sp.]|uniref:nuclear transport factor 2 family protein n=1 Tax=Segniliparus sp. TaxID=2804064 RepID=UPI003F3DFAF4